MERKIGEIFEYNGEWYQCVEGVVCLYCSFSQDGCTCDINGKLNCTRNGRNDDKSVVFKKLEKVGEPYEFDGHLFQSYRTFEVPIFTENYATVRESGNNSKISIEIKQNKEDMEEKKLNLKPFDIQKAREGKPVCTRDGRKARILCYDFKKNERYPILAAVENKDGMERALIYSNDGFYNNQDCESYNDLMMLPEKKEGWVNLYKERCYESKKEAIRHIAPGTDYIGTIKVEWEE